ncbi:serine/threonine-protein kinase [Tritonibacter mobilis]|uniref:serine/threonine-protein kinase n=1 Tax=Tritonibacter mobilis TaxID=379347 RepID=UPI000806D2A9|nr:serine/threonine-protein kinase [Tritonibacter mobilis]
MSDADKPEDDLTPEVHDEDDERTRLIAADPSIEVAPADPSSPPAPMPSSPAVPEGSEATELQPVPAPTSTEIKDPAQITLAPGTVINNNYRIQAALKSGGMGEVYRGVEVGTEDPVAIKAIRPDLIRDAQASEMFRREARTLRLLHDDAIVRYYNYVHDRDLDRYFLVMEFIDGIPLSDHIRQYGALPAAAGQTLIERIANGLAKAHAKGVVHRDLSPDNVMLASGIISEARLIDFGIAKAQTLSEGTIAGQFAGKFKYVAPEQLGHFGGQMGAAVDVYGLGLLAAAALRGKPLDMGSSIVEAVEARRKIPDLSDVPAQFRPLLSHMLEPDPTHRPATMRDVLNYLENPSAIPAHYFQDGFTPHNIGQAGATTASHLSLPPQGTMTGLQVPTPAHTSHVSAYPRAQTIAPNPFQEEPPKRRNGVLWAGLLCVVAAGGGWYAWQSGVLNVGAEQQTAAREENTSAASNGDLPSVAGDTREGFLALLDTGACSFSTRLSTGQNAGRIETYSTTDGGFEGLPAAYEERFGARPSVLPREVNSEQCSALDFVRTLQGRWPHPIGLSLSADEVESGAALQARINSQVGRPVWVALVGPNGNLYNLTQRLSSTGSGGYTLDFGLTLAQGAEAAPQLILAVSSSAPLTRAALLRDGSSSARVLPEILDEIRSKNLEASAALAYVRLNPVSEASPEDTGEVPDQE